MTNYNNDYVICQLVEIYYFLYYAHRQLNQNEIAHQFVIKVQYLLKQFGKTTLNYFGKNQSVAHLLRKYFDSAEFF